MSGLSCRLHCQLLYVGLKPGTLALPISFGRPDSLIQMPNSSVKPNAKLNALERRFWLPVFAFVGVMITLQVGLMAQESSNFDERTYLAAGYRYLRSRHFLLNPEHPPLQDLLNAAPLMLMSPPLPINEKPGDDIIGNLVERLYRGPIQVDRLLIAARYSLMAITALLIMAVAWLPWRFFGAPAGLLAASLSSLDPNIIAQAGISPLIFRALCFTL